MNRDLHHLREDYQFGELEITSIPGNPIEQFDIWFNQAKEYGIREPNTMTLCTVSQDGQPSARIVLLKSFGPDGFVFYTNYESRKGIEMLNNPKVALNFLWLTMERQVRIEGVASRISEERSAAYFQGRPKESQIGAWASPQSQVIADRFSLESSFEEIAKQYEQDDVLPKPPHWGGYEVKPTIIEFWQGRQSRLHDRIRYSSIEGEWQIDRLAP